MFKRHTLFLVLFTVLAFDGFGQRTLPASEHFDYSPRPGELRTLGSAANWSRISGTANDLNVIDGNQTFSGYPMSATGGQAEIKNGSADDLKLSFTLQSTAGTKVYASFLLRVLNNTGLGAGAYFASLGTSTSSFASRLFIKSSGSTFQLGLARNSNTATWNAVDLNLDETYLVVLGYEIVSGATNDKAYLWINPDLSGAEPTPTVTIATAVADFNIDGFFIRQASGSPNAYIDGIRVATTWADAPLPVELTSFTARAAGSVVTLNWETATEVDNNGFDVERNSTGTWQKIGFVEGHGTANSPKYYNFTDKSVTGNKIQYRLRQVDNDGTFEYSSVVEVELAPATFALDQNYPNPFNPATVIRFSLPTSSVVTLNVYNTLGEKVVTLLNGAMESGYHQVSFDAANLPSGLYLYEIKAGEFSSIKKMLLMK